MDVDEDQSRRSPEDDSRTTRRDFVAGTAKLVGAGAVALGGHGASGELVESAPGESGERLVPALEDSRPVGTPIAPPPPARVATRIVINGEAHAFDLDPRSSLLDVLREDLGLVGAKKGCDRGQCGACTVHLDGQRVLSCLTSAVQAHDRAVATIEGLIGPDGALHPMQQAFIDHDALQCGYCTPGQIMAAVACVGEGNAGSDDQIREAMSGNLCRCGAYAGIVAAVRDVAATTKAS